MFFDVESFGWKGSQKLGKAIVCKAALHAFHMGLMEEFSLRKRCIINLLWLDGTCIAGQLGLIVGRVLNLLKIGHRESHSNFAPGNLLMEKVLTDAGQGGVLRAVSFVMDPPWAHLWHPEANQVSDQ